MTCIVHYYNQYVMMAEEKVLQEGLGMLCFLESLQQQTRAPMQAHWKLSRGKLFVI